jgi:ArsR family transcriptional regulator
LGKQTLPPVSNDDLAKLFKALSHPTRIKIVEHLKAIDQSICGEIVSIFPLSQSTVSQHLKSLREAGLIKGDVEGPKTCYCLNRDMLETFKRAVALL